MCQIKACTRHGRCIHSPSTSSVKSAASPRECSAGDSFFTLHSYAKLSSPNLEDFGTWICKYVYDILWLSVIFVLSLCGKIAKYWWVCRLTGCYHLQPWQVIRKQIPFDRALGCSGSPQGARSDAKGDGTILSSRYIYIHIYYTYVWRGTPPEHVLSFHMIMWSQMIPSNFHVIIPSKQEWMWDWELQSTIHYLYILYIAFWSDIEIVCVSAEESQFISKWPARSWKPPKQRPSTEAVDSVDVGGPMPALTSSARTRGRATVSMPKISPATFVHFVSSCSIQF